MSVVTSGPGVLRGAWTVMRGATSLRHRVWMIVGMALLALIASMMTYVARDPEKAILGYAWLIMAANGVLWSGWFGRLALLRTQTRSWRLPGVGVACSHALWLGAGVLVVVPGVVLSLAGADPLIGFGLPALGALGGLLFVLIPIPLAFALVMVPGVGAPLAETLIVRLSGSQKVDLLSIDTLPIWLAVFALLVAWRWSTVVRTVDIEAIPRWRRAMVLSRPEHAVDFGATPIDADANRWQASAGWMAPATRVDDVGPHDRVRAIGAVLGGAMGRLTPRDALKQWGLIALGVGLLFVIPFHETSVGLRDALLSGGLVGLLASGWTLALRLHRQRQRVSGEFVELALLPGLGAPEEANAALLRSALRRAGHLLLFALAGFGLMAVLRDMTLPHVGLLVVLWLGVCAGSLLVCMIALAGRRLDSFRTFVVMLPLLVMVAVTLVVVFLHLPTAGFVTGLFAAWPIVMLAYLAASRPLLRQYRARPHPFLLP